MPIQVMQIMAMFILYITLLVLFKLHSVLKLFTGFASAVFTHRYATVNTAINNVANVVITNTLHDIEILTVNSCSHLFTAYHAKGDAIKSPIITNNTRSLESRFVRFKAVAPMILRIPISLVRVSEA